MPIIVRSGGHVVERWTVNRRDSGSIPPTAVLKLRRFHSHHICLSFETAGGGIEPLTPQLTVQRIKESTTGYTFRGHP